MREKLIKVAKVLGIIILTLVLISVIFGAWMNSQVDDRRSYSGETMSDGFSAGISLGSAVPTMMKSVSVNDSASTQRMFNREVDMGDASMSDKKIIKNGRLSLYVKDAEQAANDIQKMATEAGGYATNVNIQESSHGTKYGNLTIRIPVKKFESVMHNVKEFAEEIESESISADDVTEQYVDLEAQIKNLKAEEVQYLEIMKQSYTITDTLEVASRLSDVRGRIERAQGRLQYLDRQVEMSTIHINLEADSDIQIFGVRWKPITKIKRALRNMFDGLTDYIDMMIAFVFYLPVLFLWSVTVLAVLFVVLKVLKWLWHKLF